jgi:hypothetical protein
MICLPLTPTEIKDEYQIDIFETATDGVIDDTEIRDSIVAACWRRFRHRPIGDFDHEYWQDILNDRVADLWVTYRYKCQYYKDRMIMDLSTSRSEESRTHETQNISDVIRDSSSSDTTTYDVTVDDTSTSETENLPDTPVVAGSEYLSTRGKNTGQNKQTGTTGNVGSTDETISTTGNVSGTSTGTVTRQDGLTVELLNRVYDNLRNPFSDFAKELDPIFMNRW